MAQYQTRPARALDKVDPVWARIRSEAEDVARREPELATFIYENILHHDTLETAIAHRVSQRLDHADVSADLIRQAYHDALEDQPTLGEAFRADIVATIDRDPATSRFIRAGALLQRFPRDPDPSPCALALRVKAARISRFTCKAVRHRYSSATSIRLRKSVAAFSSTTPPGWSSARLR